MSRLRATTIRCLAASAMVVGAGTACAQANPPVPSCATLTERAMSVDLQAANAQAQRTAVAELARLMDESTALWKHAVELCTGRAKERAQRNLADSTKSRADVGALQGAGENCLALQKDASVLEELARRVLGERRFAEAAQLFRRAETQWDLAAERCTGAQQKTASQRRELAETDAHNAEHCAPRFQLAMEQTQRLRSTGAAMSPADKQTQSQIAETHWRVATQHCKAAALELARAQAQTLARERGTPWVATLPPSSEPVPAPMAAAAPSTATGVPPGAPGTAAGGPPAAASSSRPLPSSAVPTAASALAAPAAPLPIDIAAEGNARYVGQFALDPGGLSYTGQGKVIWANGESYDGALVRGRRHGLGEFIWASGQRYRGEWADDRPQGKGQWRFANGNEYEGRVANGQPQGAGRMAYASGDAYQGEFDHGEPDGQGEYRWASGQRYDGQWVKGSARGRGRMVFANGNAYEGEFVDGQPQGQGRMAYAGGDVYSGRFSNGEPDGEGVYTWASGQRYSGPWKLGVAGGRAQMSFANGNQYEGEIANGVPHGEGRMRYASGDTYQGRFVRGVPDGEGSFAWSNGDTYHGGWKAGLREGQGAMQWTNGDRWQGLFRAGEPTDQGTLVRSAKQ